MKMVVTKRMNQSETLILKWDRKFPFDKKISILRSYFNRPLDQVAFWKLYKLVKKLNS